MKGIEEEIDEETQEESKGRRTTTLREQWRQPRRQTHTSIDRQKTNISQTNAAGGGVGWGGCGQG